MSAGRWGKRCWGNWRCSGCGKFLRFQRRPPTCDCGGEWLYREVAVEYKGLTGHVDMVVDYRKLGVQVKDLKTTSLKTLLQDEGILPRAAHIIQVETYCEALYEQHGLEVESYTIDYCAREHPGIWIWKIYGPIPWTPTRRRFRVARLRQETSGRKLAIRSLLLPAESAIQHTLAAQRIVQHRPCVSPAHYQELMSPAFAYEKNRCHHWESCTSCSTADVWTGLRDLLIDRADYIHSVKSKSEG